MPPSQQMNLEPGCALQGYTVLVTRPQHQAAVLCGLLQQHGASVLPLPLIEICHAPLTPELTAQLDALRTANWVVFTSQNGVDATCSLLSTLQMSNVLQNKAIAVVGQQTANRLREHGYSATIVSATQTGEALVKTLRATLPTQQKLQWVVCQGSLAQLDWIQAFYTTQWHVTPITVYTTRPDMPPPDLWANVLEHLQHHSLNIATFTSASAVHAFAHCLQKAGIDPPSIRQHTRLVAIGPSTQAALEMDFKGADATAQPHTLEALVSCCITLANAQQKG